MIAAYQATVPFKTIRVGQQFKLAVQGAATTPETIYTRVDEYAQGRYGSVNAHYTSLLSNAVCTEWFFDNERVVPIEG